MYVKKIWITGASGRLGSTLYRYLDPLELEILATDKHVVDITNSKEVNQFVDRNRPDIIINCSGLTKRNYCQEHENEAYLLNGVGAKNIAIASRRARSKLVHLSTGDVFDGNTLSPYKETDTANPVTVYGKSKYFGEKMVRQFTPYHFIIRTSRLYSKENGYVEDIIKQAKENKEVNVPKNQFASPTSAYELTKFILYLIDTTEYGTYHASCKGVCSRKEFAEEVLKILNINAKVKEVRDEQIDFKPQFLALQNFILDITDGYNFSHWKQALRKYLENEV
ncbi:MAG: NAD(P)-dependent oxidoreductase [Tissierellia bacterium]|nr:NAD(P)-dependent oxidoreductase [Tissierellia bacterium]